VKTPTSQPASNRPGQLAAAIHGELLMATAQPATGTRQAAGREHVRPRQRQERSCETSCDIRSRKGAVALDNLSDQNLAVIQNVSEDKASFINATRSGDKEQ